MSTTNPRPDTTATDPVPDANPGFVESITLGWKVLISELKWLFFNGFRRWEIRQLKKRLNEEYANLGMLSADVTHPDRQAMDRSRRQIDFLEEEIDYLENEIQSARQELVEERVRKWGLTGASSERS